MFCTFLTLLCVVTQLMGDIYPGTITAVTTVVHPASQQLYAAPSLLRRGEAAARAATTHHGATLIGFHARTVERCVQEGIRNVGRVKRDLWESILNVDFAEYSLFCRLKSPLAEVPLKQKHRKDSFFSQ